MCIPHAPNKTFKADRRERAHKPKMAKPFNKKLLEPDPDFKDERKEVFNFVKKEQSLLDKLFSILH